MPTTIRRAIGLLVCLTASVSTALAQPPGSSRPFRGIFGSARGPLATHMLDVTATLLEAYDDDVLAETGSTFGPVAGQVGGYFTILAPSVRYQKVGTRVQISANVASTLGYYPDFGGLRSLSHTAGVGFASQLGRTRVMVNQSLAYSPAYLYGLFPSVEPVGPGSTIPGAADYEVNNSRSYYYGTAVSVSRPLTRRGTISASAQYAATDFQGAAAVRRPDVTSYGVQTSFARHLSRNATFRIGYSYRGGDVGGDGIHAESIAHGIDVGADYSRPLSATRRAAFGFTLGSSSVSAAEAAGLPGQDQRYRAHGGMSLGYQFNASWQARATYRRDLQYVPEISEPVFSDGLGLSVDGLLSPRLDFLASAGYSNASSALSQDAAMMDTYTANVRLRYALTRFLALYGEYLYYFYEFTQRTPLSATVPPGLERSGVRVGLTMWVPLLRR